MYIPSEFFQGDPSSTVTLRCEIKIGKSLASEHCHFTATTATRPYSFFAPFCKCGSGRVTLCPELSEIAMPAVPPVPAIPVFRSPDGRIVVMILQAQRRDVLACFASPRSKSSNAKNCYAAVIVVFDSANRELSQSLCHCARADPKTLQEINSDLTEVRYPMVSTSTGRAV